VFAVPAAWGDLQPRFKWACRRGGEGNVERGGEKRKERKGKGGIRKGGVALACLKIPEGTHASIYY